MYYKILKIRIYGFFYYKHLKRLNFNKSRKNYSNATIIFYDCWFYKNADTFETEKHGQL